MNAPDETWVAFIQEGDYFYKAFFAIFLFSSFLVKTMRFEFRNTIKNTLEAKYTDSTRKFQLLICSFCETRSSSHIKNLHHV